MSEHMNGHAGNGADEDKDLKFDRLACEKPMVEIEALAVAIYVMGYEADSDKFGIRIGEAISKLSWMIRERAVLIDRSLFPNGPTFDENHDAKEAGNG